MKLFYRTILLQIAMVAAELGFWGPFIGEAAGAYTVDIAKGKSQS